MARAPGMIRRRGRGWNVVLRVHGRRYEFGPRTEPFLAQATRKRDVVLWAQRKLVELDRIALREAAGLPTRVRVSELLDRYAATKLPTLRSENTRTTYRTSLAAFRRYFVVAGRDPRLSQVRPALVREFLTWRAAHAPDGQPARVSARTVAKDRAVLHAVFEFAAELELVDANPVARTAAPRSDPRAPVIISDEELDRLVAAAERDAAGRPLAEGPMLRTYILLLAETGMRADSEALWLRWEDLDFEAGFIRVASGRDGHRTKSGRERWVPMTPRLAAALREHALRFRGALYDGAPSPWVFHHLYHRRHARAGERVKSFRRGFEAARRRAKLPDALRRHDLRHRRITTWLAEGRDVVLVREAVGHADLRTTMGYTHLVREHLRRLVDWPAKKTVAAAGKSSRPL